MTTRLLLVDDHPLVRHGLRLRLESVPGLQVVCEASRAEEALQLAQEYEPEIAVVDLGLPDTSGLELTTLLLRRAPNLAVLIMTMHAGDDYIVRAVDAGARGYILKDAPIAQVVSAIEALAAGGSFFSPDVMRLMKSGSPAVALSERQRQILDYLVEGYSNKEIARLLNVSVRTIESHRLVIKRKLGAERAVDLLRRAVRLGFTHL
jgi:two-component system, NarL family, nitrate/nitrite response regulator NarL